MTSPEFNTPSPEAYNLLMNRRSVRTRDMQAPGPDRQTVTQILAAGMRVPDHGKLAPWRFIVLDGDERRPLGEAIARTLKAEKDVSENTAEKMKDYATQAPTLIVAIFSPSDARPIPLWEQQLSMGASCQNIMIAATALGVASQWLSGWASYSRHVCDALGMQKHEQIAGFIFLGDPAPEPPKERERPTADDHIIWGWPKSTDNGAA